ncbi:MAG TPA: hypothetical protein VF590_16780 [Isosphaeraceae bacterium]|jgi:hypothetical protein
MPRGWTRLWIAGATVLGSVLGIVLTIISVVLPEAGRLAQERAPSPFVAGFSPQAWIERVSPVSVGPVDEVLDQEQPDGPPWGRTFETTLRLGPPQQDLLISQLETLIAAELRSTGVNSWSSRFSLTPGPGPLRRHHRSFQYRRDQRAGAVFIQTVGGAEDLIVLISIHER